MQLITLNIWGGQVHDPLIKFINKHKDQTDIFTFQEIFKSDRDVITHGSHSNILGELKKILPDFNYYFASTGKNNDTRGPVDFPLDFGQGTFVKKNLEIMEQGDLFVYKKFNDMTSPFPDKRPNFPRNIIHTEIMSGNKKFLVINLHGFWEPAPKYDTPQRFAQSQIIIDFIKKKGLPAVLAGDFNLSITTRSLAMFEESDLRNLVKESKAPTTRSSHYDNKYRSFDKYADYIFTSKGIWVSDFKVMKDEVSDHLPLFLEFEV